VRWVADVGDQLGVAVDVHAVVSIMH
jgi:hypothetical protein